MAFDFPSSPTTGQVFNSYVYDGQKWTLPASTISNLIVGPSSATDNAAVRFDSTTGKVAQDSALLIADTTGDLSRNGNGGIDIQGTNTNDAAPTGYIGEYISTTGSGVSLTSSTVVNCGSVVLTAGDWDISYIAKYATAGATTTTRVTTALSTANNNLTPAVGTAVQTWVASTADLSVTNTFPPMRVSLSGSTTYYLNAQAVFATSTAEIQYFSIQARRVR